MVTLSTRPYDRDRYGSGGGESYRPGRSPPPRVDSFRNRSPPRRPPPADFYIPTSGRPVRPRSRSPPFRRRSRSPRGFRNGDNGAWRERQRSPPRRAFSPRGDDYRRPRSPVRDTRGDRYGRSPPRPVRERSPLPLKRSREVSPAGSRGMRSPPPMKRERLVSPPRRYEQPRSRAQRYSDKAALVALHSTVHSDD